MAAPRTPSEEIKVKADELLQLLENIRLRKQAIEDARRQISRDETEIANFATKRDKLLEEVHALMGVDAKTGKFPERG